jgi:hypothetical protein
LFFTYAASSVCFLTPCTLPSQITSLNHANPLLLFTVHLRMCVYIYVCVYIYTYIYI